MEKIAYFGQKNCYAMRNEFAQLVVTSDLGPRIIFYGRPDGENQLGEFPELEQETDYGTWRPYGGHRLWASPEALPFSYAPDNDVVEVLGVGAFALRTRQKIDAAGMEKEMLISLEPGSSRVEVTHKVTNRRTDPVEIGAWALTIFKGGSAHVPLAPFRSHDDALLPSQPLVLWPFTDLADPRIALGHGWLEMKCDPSLQSPQKLGLANRLGWAAHYGGSELFVKKCVYLDGGSYPDFGANTEVYVAGTYMEIETLSPLARLQPGESVQHWESWELFSVQNGELASRLDALKA